MFFRWTMVFSYIWLYSGVLFINIKKNHGNRRIGVISSLGSCSFKWTGQKRRPSMARELFWDNWMFISALYSFAPLPSLPFPLPSSLFPILLCLFLSSIFSLPFSLPFFLLHYLTPFLLPPSPNLSPPHSVLLSIPSSLPVASLFFFFPSSIPFSFLPIFTSFNFLLHSLSFFPSLYICLYFSLASGTIGSNCNPISKWHRDFMHYFSCHPMWS